MKRLVFDFILLALYILVMNFNFTRHTGHEVLGCIFFVAVLIHLFLNRRWFKSLFRGVVPLELARNMTLHRLHKWAPFVMLILLGFHLGWHGSSIWPRIARLFGLTPGKGAGNIIAKVLQALTVILGIYGSFFYQIGDRLEMVHLFGVRGKPTLFLFGILHLSIIGLYSLIGRYLQVLIQKRRSVSRSGK